MKTIKKQGFLLVFSILLLVAVLFYASFAWFTKMTNVAGMQFSVAKWDFVANNSISDYKITAYEYQTLDKGLAAPGTAGEIPISLSAEYSETDVEYYVTVDKTSMSSDFQKRINFYYKNEAGEKMPFLNEGTDLTGIIKAHGTATAIVYWEWIYELPQYEETITDSEGTAITVVHTVEDNNKFDLSVGQNPEAFVNDMNATIKIAGVQVEPELAQQ